MPRNKRRACMNILACLMGILMDVLLFVPVADSIRIEFGRIESKNRQQEAPALFLGNMCDIPTDAVTNGHSHLPRMVGLPFPSGTRESYAADATASMVLAPPFLQNVESGTFPHRVRNQSFRRNHRESTQFVVAAYCPDLLGVADRLAGAQGFY